MLTPAQRTTLKAAILADPAIATKPMSPDGHFDVAVYLNQSAAPNFTVWRTSVAVNLLTGPGFDWTRVDNLTVGKARIWDFMTKVGTLNPSETQVRAGFEACFATDPADNPCRLAIYQRASRLGSRVEKIFATGTGAVPDSHGVGPATMSFEGPISPYDVQTARES